MLFPYHFNSPLTPSAVKIQRENLKEFERQHFADFFAPIVETTLLNKLVWSGQ
jgi:hypothetical protein